MKASNDIIDCCFTLQERALLIRALSMAAQRLEAQARSNPRGRNCSAHEQNAACMRTLGAKLARLKARAPEPEAAE